MRFLTVRFLVNAGLRYKIIICNNSLNTQVLIAIK